MITVLGLFKESQLTTVLCFCAEYCTFTEPLATQKDKIWVSVNHWYTLIDAWERGRGAVTFDILSCLILQKAELRGL